MNRFQNRHASGQMRVLGPALFLVGAGAWAVTEAAEPAYQAFFTGACPAAPGGSNLENVCLAAGTGISGDSESSLNPSQPLAGNDQPLARAREKAAALQNDNKDGPGQAGTAAPALQLGPFSLLVNARGAWVDRDASGGERGYDGDTYSVELGLDRRLSPRTVVGGFVSYEHDDLRFDGEAATTFAPPSNAGRTQVESASLVLFGVHNLGDAAYLEAATGYGVGDYRFHRNAVAQDSNSTFTIPVRTRGDSDGRDYWVSAGAGYEVSRGAASYGVFGRATWARAKIDGYREKDLNASGLNLIVEQAKRSSLTTTLGLRAGRALSFDWGVLVPEARLEYEHEFENDPPSVASAFAVAPGASFSPARDKPDQDWFNLAVGAQFILPGGMMPFVEAEALLGQRNFDRYRLLLGLRSEF